VLVSSSAIVAVKPTNKAERSAAEQSAAETTAAESVERRAETKGNVDQQRVWLPETHAQSNMIVIRSLRQFEPAPQISLSRSRLICCGRR
jgi:hypothetical protein